MRRVKVLYLAQHLTMGGAEELLLGVARGLPAERFDVVVGCLTREGLIARELKQAGVRVVLLRGEPGPRNPIAFIRLCRFIRAERPDVLHTFLLNAGLYGRLAGCLSGVQVIYHAEQNIYLEKSRRHLALERLLSARTTRIVACCQAVGNFYAQQVGIRREQLQVIYNAVDFGSLVVRDDRAAARAELGYGNDEIVLGCIGRLTEQKGQDILLEAVAALKEDQPNLRVMLVGEGPRLPDLRGITGRLGLAGQVRFLGVRRDRETLYSAMDVFVLPSRWEGLSLALVEAAGLGLPIVATSVGGNAEVLQDLPGVKFVAPGDSRALSFAIRQVSSAIEEAAVGVKVLYPRPEVRERFNLASHLEALEASYRLVLGLPAETQARGGGETPSRAAETASTFSPSQLR